MKHGATRDLIGFYGTMLVSIQIENNYISGFLVCLSIYCAFSYIMKISKED